MNTSRNVALGVLVGLALLVTVLAAAPAFADEPPPGPAVPPTPGGQPVTGDPLAPPGAPADPAPVDEPAADEPMAEDVWTPPITEPTRQPSQDMLPDPVVRDPKTGRQTGGRTPRSQGPGTTTTPRRTPVGPRTSPASASGTAAPAPVRRGQIESLEKHHNQTLGGVGPALRFDIEFSVRGLRGRTLYVAAWFARQATGDSIAPTMPEYADGEGRLSAQTQGVQVLTDQGRFSASVWVPYGAFPAPDDGDAYGVDAIVLLIARGSGGTDTILSRSETTFTVHAN